MKAAVTTRVLDPSEYPAWARVVAASPSGSAYSLPDYLDALCAATGARFRILVAERGGAIVGGIGLYERVTRLGTSLSPRLLLYFNGLVLVPHEAKYPSVETSWELQTLTALESALSAQRYARLRIRSTAPVGDVRPFLAAGWSAQPSYTYVVSIADLDQARSRIEQNLRRLASRCEERGMTVAEDDDFESFYRLHLDTHERKRVDLYLPREPFRRFVSALRERRLGRLYHARLPDGRAVATQLVLVGHPVTHTIVAGGDVDAMRMGATAFLRVRVFQDLSALGYRAVDLTDAALNPVTHFKSQLGGDLTTCMTVSRGDRPLFALGDRLAAAWKRARGLPGGLRRRLARGGAR